MRGAELIALAERHGIDLTHVELNGSAAPRPWSDDGVEIIPARGSGSSSATRAPSRAKRAERRGARIRESLVARGQVLVCRGHDLLLVAVLGPHLPGAATRAARWVGSSGARSAQRATVLPSPPRHARSGSRPEPGTLRCSSGAVLHLHGGEARNLATSARAALSRAGSAVPAVA